MLIDWINDVLVGERIIVKDLAEDLYDGQVLQKLFGKKLNRVRAHTKPLRHEAELDTHYISSDCHPQTTVPVWDELHAELTVSLDKFYVFQIGMHQY